MNQFAQHVTAYIESQGHKTDTYAEDGSSLSSIRFRTRGSWFSLLVDEDDRGFVQLSCSYPLPEHVTADAVAMDILLRAQDRVKCVKFSAIDERRRLVGNVELLLPEGDAVERVFWRAVGMVESAMRETINELRNTVPARSAAEKFIAEFTTGGAA